MPTPWEKINFFYLDTSRAAEGVLLKQLLIQVLQNEKH